MKAQKPSSRKLGIYEFIYKLLLILIIIRLTIIGINLFEDELTKQRVSLSGFLFVDLIDELFASWDILLILIPYFLLFLHSKKIWRLS
ncbi:MAG: hypothetical protein ABIC19_00760 [Patescibacteria group bacterium]|nr:hypothetical protein [Patescibacteria group bacterium]